MIDPRLLFDGLRNRGLRFFTGVPDSLLKDFCAYVTEHAASEEHVISTNEGSAVALGTGFHLATGRVPVIYLQNSGFGNAINPLMSLAGRGVYGVPMLILVGWRGEPGTRDEPQHMAQGESMKALLRALGIQFSILGPETVDLDQLLDSVMASLEERSEPHVVLVRKGTFAPYVPVPPKPDGFTRVVAITATLASLPNEAVVVATTGMASREVFDYRERLGQSHELDFLTVGSMGHASQIALGIAREMPDRLIVCLDGDGSVLMHMGALAVNGSHRRANLLHIVINNGAHDSVGGQPTVARDIDLAAIARSCGYGATSQVAHRTDLEAELPNMIAGVGPRLLEVRVASDPDAVAGRPSVSPIANKLALMRALGSRGT